jgi:Protein of unknown function (DUF3435)
MVQPPCPYIDLVGFICARALQDRAFQVGYKTVSDLYNKPILDTVDVVPLQWVEDVMDLPVYSLNYEIFRNIWNRVCCIIGLRVTPPCRAVRLGAGGRLDGVLADAVRNFVMDHTGPTFQQSYQSTWVRKDLTALAFGPKGGEQEKLFERFRNMSLDRDENAPTALSESDLVEIESRGDVRELVIQYENLLHEGKVDDANRCVGLLTYKRNRAKDLRLKKLRDDYFFKADNSRALGIAVSKTSAQASPSKNGTCGKGHIPRLVSLLRNWEAEESEVRVTQWSFQWTDLLLSHMTFAPIPSNARVPVTSQGRFRCLLCNTTLSSRQSLTSHAFSTHLMNGAFDRPFNCPECEQNSYATIEISGPSNWSNHAERVHGKPCAPDFPTVGNYQTHLARINMRNGCPALTSTELERLIKLKAQNESWKVIAREYPNHTIGYLKHMWRRKRPPQQPVKLPPSLTPEDLELVVSMRASNKSWRDIHKKFPNRKIETIKSAWRRYTSKQLEDPSLTESASSPHWSSLGLSQDSTVYEAESDTCQASLLITDEELELPLGDCTGSLMEVGIQDSTHYEVDERYAGRVSVDAMHEYELPWGDWTDL